MIMRPTVIGLIALLMSCMLTLCFIIGSSQIISLLQLSKKYLSLPSIILNYGTGSHQFGELRLPDSLGMHPIIIMIHGECWKSSLPGVALMDVSQLIVSGLMDKIVPSVFAHHYGLLAKQSGDKVEILDIKNAGHSLSSLSPRQRLG